MKPKTQTFALGKYRLDIIDEDIKGLCDVPSEYDILRLMIPNGNTLKRPSNNNPRSESR